METPQIFSDIAIITLTALLGGLAAHRLRQPALAGYLVGGLLVGPAGLGIIPDAAQIQTPATFGLVFLMFTLGVEVSLSTILQTRAVPLAAGILQIGVTVLLWLIIGQLLGWPPAQSLLFGYVLALTSSAIVLKLLSDRGELDAPHGRFVVGISVFQDLTLVPVMVVIASLPHGETTFEPLAMLGTAAIALLKSGAVLGGMLLLGRLVVPWVLHRVAASQSRELFVLTVFVIAVGTATLAVSMGISLALGAFIAGVVISDTDYSHQALADIVPLRDVFSSLFFVSIGMLTNPRFIAENIGLLSLRWRSSWWASVPYLPLACLPSAIHCGPRCSPALRCYRWESSTSFWSAQLWRPG